MANYNTNLSDWGAAGSAPPSGYKYSENEPPVDKFDNYLMDNIITDLQHLTSLTNDRVESDAGTSRPSSPENAHVFADTGTGELEWYDTTSSSWSRALDATGDTMGGSLTLSAGATLGSSLSSDTGTTLYDYGSDHIPSSAVQKAGLDADTLEGNEPGDLGTTISNSGSAVVDPATGINFGSNINVSDDGDGTVTVSVNTTSDTHTAISESGTEIVGSTGDINFQGHLNVIDDGDGSISVDPTHNHDSRYYTKSEVESWVNNNADVPNANYADSAGDANTLDGNHASAFATGTDLSNHAGDNNAHHSRYSDAEARSAVDNSNVSVGYADNAGNVDGYDVQKNGSDTSGVINFKT